VALDFLAAGLDPKNARFSCRASESSYELPLLWDDYALGWLERVPSYKEMQENLANKDLTTYGFLLSVLMASDILLYQADLCCGTGPAAHVELTREIARRFNFFYPKKHMSRGVESVKFGDLVAKEGKKSQA